MKVTVEDTDLLAVLDWLPAMSQMKPQTRDAFMRLIAAIEFAKEIGSVKPNEAEDNPLASAVLLGQVVVYKGNEYLDYPALVATADGYLSNGSPCPFDKVGLIKIIREFTGMGLKEAIQTVTDQKTFEVPSVAKLMREVILQRESGKLGSIPDQPFKVMEYFGIPKSVWAFVTNPKKKGEGDVG